MISAAAGIAPSEANAFGWINIRKCQEFVRYFCTICVIIVINNCYLVSMQVADRFFRITFIHISNYYPKFTGFSLLPLMLSFSILPGRLFPSGCFPKVVSLSLFPYSCFHKVVSPGLFPSGYFPKVISMKNGFTIPAEIHTAVSGLSAVSAGIF